MGFYIGALIGTYLITKFFKWLIYKVIFKKKMTEVIAAFSAFVASVIFVFVAHKPNFVFDNSFLYVYFPSLIVWLFIGIRIDKLWHKKFDNEEEIRSVEDEEDGGSSSPGS